MKTNTPSLFFYFIACALVVFFKITEDDSLVLYTKSIIVPLIFMYYLITNNYKINWTKGLVFLFCFIGDIFNLLQFNDSGLGALLSFMLVYVLLLKLAVDDFKYLKLNKEDCVPMLVSFFFIATICTSILSLNFERMKLDFSLYILYGITLSLLCFFSIINYLKKVNYTFFCLIVMCGCFMISDVFFVINKFYLNLYAFSFIAVFVQVFSYFFMATYFIENDRYHQRQRVKL
ncbi:YhhN-like protein [Flavobacterium fluvii]|uniref:YhhN-like protein n=1 Tax=Flavobacterium fluvii TaxID=468056 RepID=A0A1M5HQG1_9FLAO|nr:lysoplasmalogenase family protein [Flavobacterium fluvii]SHG18167.1 YhhN-like protein [Flavobacterium fluvii]